MGLFRKKRSPYWWYSIMRDGRRVFASTGTKDKKLADMSFTRMKDNLIKGELTGKLAPITVAALLERYMTYSKVNKISHLTDAARVANLTEFLGNKVAGSLTSADLDSYKAARKATLRGGKPIAPSTINRELQVLRAAYNKGIEWKLVKHNPVVRVFLSEKGRVRDRRLTPEEKAKLLSVSSPELRRFILMGLKTGGRHSEILNLKWKDVDFARNTIAFRVTKTGEPRRVPIHPDALEVLRGLPRHGEYVFADADGKRYNRSSWIRYQFERAVDQAGIRGVVIHTLRHAFASELVEKGVDLKTVAELLGHSSTRMVDQVYAHLSPSHKGLAVNLLPSEELPAAPMPTVLRELQKTGSRV